MAHAVNVGTAVLIHISFLDPDSVCKVVHAPVCLNIIVRRLEYGAEIYSVTNIK